MLWEILVADVGEFGGWCGKVWWLMLEGLVASVGGFGGLVAGRTSSSNGFLLNRKY